MSDTSFHLTRMGHTYYEATMPALVRELARLNDNIERMLAVAEGGGERAQQPAASPSPKEQP